MMTTQITSQALAEAAAALPDNGLVDARQAAIAAFGRNGFPTQRDEDWKYTDLNAVADLSRRWLDASSPVAEPEIERIRDIQASVDAAWLVFANGRLLEDLSPGLSEPGVDVGTLGTEAALRFDDPLADLNTALLVDGAQLSITSDLSGSRPVGILVADTTAGLAGMAQCRIEIELSANAAARFIEYHTSTGEQKHYSNTLIKLRLGDGARADYVRLQRRGNTHSQTQRLNVHLNRHSTLRHCGIDLGGMLTRNDLKIDIAEAGATASFSGLYVIGENQHVDNHTRVDHRVGPAVSNQEYRGILSGKCRAVWNGKAVVHKGADGTDATQANHNLLLSSNSEIDAKPELEIYADEVKCAHGTTVGQLDDDALFYLRSRGLDHDAARHALVRAFATSIVSSAPIEELHEHIRELVEQRLGEVAALGANGGQT